MSKFLHKTGLTKKEQIMIGFLLLCIAGGVVLQLSGWKRPQEFDYTRSDKNFEKQVSRDLKELENIFKDSLKEKRLSHIKKMADSLSAKDEDNSNISSQLKGMKININSGYAADLKLLPGIGEVMAERIIDHREQNGNFKKPEDLLKVKGIGEKKFEKIKDHVTVE